jgi:hypothetical protein
MGSMLIGPERAESRDLRAWSPFLLALVLALVIPAAVGCGASEERFAGTWVNVERNVTVEITSTDSVWTVYVGPGSEGSEAREEDGKLIWGYRDSQVFEISGEQLKWTMKEPQGEVVYLERSQ